MIKAQFKISIAILVESGSRPSKGSSIAINGFGEKQARSIANSFRAAAFKSRRSVSVGTPIRMEICLEINSISFRFHL